MENKKLETFDLIKEDNSHIDLFEKKIQIDIIKIKGVASDKHF